MTKIKFDPNLIQYTKKEEEDEVRKARDRTICTHLNNGVRFLVVMEAPGAEGVSIKDVRHAVIRVLRGNTVKNSRRVERLAPAMNPPLSLGFKDEKWYEERSSKKSLNDRIFLEQFQKALEDAFGEQFAGIKLLTPKGEEGEEAKEE